MPIQTKQQPPYYKESTGNNTKYFIGALNQNSTSAPTATNIQNDIGTIIWTRNGIGDYKGTLTGAFPENKRWVIIGTGGAYSDSANDYITYYAYFAPGDEDNVWINSEHNGLLADGQLADTPILIITKT